MNEDLEALTKMMDQLEHMAEIADKNKDQFNDSDNNNMFLIELGKRISDLEHRVEMLKDENAFLRMLLKENFGYSDNT